MNIYICIYIYICFLYWSLFTCRCLFHRSLLKRCMYSLLHLERHPILVSFIGLFSHTEVSFQKMYVQLIACGVSSNLNLQSPSHWSLINGTSQKRTKPKT